MVEDPMIAALLRERAGYVTRGLDDRVEQVDEQLKVRGHTPPGAKPDAEAAGDPATEQPKARRTPPKRTAKG